MPHESKQPAQLRQLWPIFGEMPLGGAAEGEEAAWGDKDWAAALESTEGARGIPLQTVLDAGNGVPERWRGRFWYLAVGGDGTAAARRAELGDGWFERMQREFEYVWRDDPWRQRDWETEEEEAAEYSVSELYWVLTHTPGRSVASYRAQYDEAESTLRQLAETFLAEMEAEEAFWALTAFVDDVLPEGFFGARLVGFHAERRLLNDLMVSTIDGAAELEPDRRRELNSIVGLRLLLPMLLPLLQLETLWLLVDMLAHSGWRMLLRIVLSLVRTQLHALKPTAVADLAELIASLTPRQLARLACDRRIELPSDTDLERMRTLHRMSVLQSLSAVDSGGRFTALHKVKALPTAVLQALASDIVSHDARSLTADDFDDMLASFDAEEVPEFSRRQLRDAFAQLLNASGTVGKLHAAVWLALASVCSVEQKLRVCWRAATAASPDGCADERTVTQLLRRVLFFTLRPGCDFMTRQLCWFCAQPCDSSAALKACDCEGAIAHSACLMAAVAAADSARCPACSAAYAFTPAPPPPPPDDSDPSVAAALARTAGRSEARRIAQLLMRFVASGSDAELLSEDDFIRGALLQPALLLALEGKWDEVQQRPPRRSVLAEQLSQRRASLGMIGHSNPHLQQVPLPEEPEPVPRVRGSKGGGSDDEEEEEEEGEEGAAGRRGYADGEEDSDDDGVDDDDVALDVDSDEEVDGKKGKASGGGGGCCIVM